MSNQASTSGATPTPNTLVTSGYAPVNGLEMYYEQHGTGGDLPVVLLHGGLATIDWPNGPFMRELAKTRTIYALEFQSHGRTANIDRPFTFENLRDDVIAFIEHLQLGTVDLVGFSIGGVTAIGTAIARPDLVRRVVPISSLPFAQWMRQENMEGMASFVPGALAGTPMEQAYKEIAPDPEDFDSTLLNLSKLNGLFAGWPEDELKAYPAPTLLVIGDSDAVTLGDALAFFRLRGGDVNADFVGEPVNRLAVLPGPGHFAFMDYVDPLIAVIEPWLGMPDEPSA
jgi:pimeloyl-ACP methyl ester carboxylesterase